MLRSARKLLNNLNTARRESGFTLIEMLVVMGIIGVIFSLSFGGFFGMRRTQQMEQSALNLRSDLRLMRRKALLLERGQGEAWVYGYGADLSSLIDRGQYDLKKIFGGTGQSSYMAYDVPEYNEGSEFVVTLDGGADKTLPLKGFPSGSEISGDIQAVFFEAVNGKPHFYDQNTGAEQFPDQLAIRLESGSSCRQVIIHGSSGRIELVRGCGT